MNDGSITGNNATSSYTAGGVYVSEGAFMMNGGMITGNNGGNYGAGGVYVSAGGSHGMTVSGAARVTGNVKGGMKEPGASAYTGGTASNVYLEILYITIGGALTADAQIGVTLANSYGTDKTFTAGWSDKMPGKDAA